MIEEWKRKLNMIGVGYTCYKFITIIWLQNLDL
jgi:hypothetical protein